MKTSYCPQKSPKHETFEMAVSMKWLLLETQFFTMYLVYYELEFSRFR